MGIARAGWSLSVRKVILKPKIMMGRPGPWLLLVVVASVASGHSYADDYYDSYENYDDYEGDYYELHEGSGGERRAEGPPWSDLIIPDENEEQPVNNSDQFAPPNNYENNHDSNYDNNHNNNDRSAPPKEDVSFVRNYEDNDYDDEDYDNHEGSGGPRRIEPLSPRTNLVIPAEDEQEPNVDSSNYDQSAPPKEDDLFVRNDKEDRTESPEVDQVPTNHNLPWIVAVVIGGAVLGLLFILFMVFRMRKREKEGSNALDEPKKAHNLSEPKIIGV